MSRRIALLSIAVAAAIVAVPAGIFLMGYGNEGVVTQVEDAAPFGEPGAFSSGPGDSDAGPGPTVVGGSVHHTVTWKYSVDTWYSGVLSVNNRTTTFSFSVSVSDYIRALEADVPRSSNLGSMGLLVDPEQPQVTEIAAHIMALEGTPKARLDCALKFVQSLKYSDDMSTHGVAEFWSLPAETLYTMEGDCEDLAFLFVSIAEAMGYDAVLVSTPGHLAAAVSADGLSGDRYVFQGKEYFYCETSALDVGGLNIVGFRGNVGDRPDGLGGERAFVHQVGPIS